MNVRPQACRTGALDLRGFGAGFGDRVVLAEIDLQIPATGLFCLLGPAGVGKSTLLRIIAGIAQQSASVKCWGQIRYLGRALGDGVWPAIVVQDARMLVATVQENLASGLRERTRLTQAEQLVVIGQQLRDLGLSPLLERLHEQAVDLPLVEQRLVAIARQIFAGPALLCVDEPTAGLNDEDAERLLGLLHRWSRQAAVLMVCHNQQQVRRHGDHAALLAGGRIKESAPVQTFFSAPQSSELREFIDRGTCHSPRPDARAEDLAGDLLPPPPLPVVAHKAMSAWAGPRGFVWLERGRLAGTPMPGVVDELGRDLSALARVGVTRLLTLLEQPLPFAAALAERGIQSLHVEVADMAPPTIAQAESFCRQIDQWLSDRQVVAVHCRAGLGRTGTALAAYRIFKGSSAVEAVEGVRRLEPRWIQSAAQIAFLVEFSRSRRRSP